MFDHAKQSAKDALKKTKLLIEMSQESQSRIIQKQLQINMTKKCLKKDIFSRRKKENYWWSESNIKIQLQNIKK